jgi:hypothetical protein
MQDLKIKNLGGVPNIHYLDFKDMTLFFTENQDSYSVRVSFKDDRQSVTLWVNHRDELKLMIR